VVVYTIRTYPEEHSSEIEGILPYLEVGSEKLYIPGNM